MAKITKKRVESIKPGDRDVFEWDDELRGFGVRIKPSGVRSYIIQYRNRFGRSRRQTGPSSATPPRWRNLRRAI